MFEMQLNIELRFKHRVKKACFQHPHNYHGIDCDFGFHGDGYFFVGCFFPASDFGFDCVYDFVLMKLAVAASLGAFPVAFP